MCVLKYRYRLKCVSSTRVSQKTIQRLLFCVNDVSRYSVTSFLAAQKPLTGPKYLLNVSEFWYINTVAKNGWQKILKTKKG